MTQNETPSLSLYGQYIKERSNRGILEIDGAFATFDYIGDMVYIVDIFVAKEKRRSKVGFELADTIVKQAISDGKKFLIGTVDTGTPVASDSLKFQIAYGLRAFKTVDQMIFLSKPIGDTEYSDIELKALDSLDCSMWGVKA